jgi:nuclear transport factor 2 (NTF2) superfamily protein
MLDRQVIQEFVRERFQECGYRLPKGISWVEFTEAFCRWTERDYYEWLKDNYKHFFNHGDPNWDEISKRVQKLLHESEGC